MSDAKVRKLFTKDALNGFTCAEVAEMFDHPDVAMLAAIERKIETGDTVVRGKLLGLVRERRCRKGFDRKKVVRSDLFCDIKDLSVNDDGEIPSGEVLTGLIAGVKKLRGPRAWKYVTAFIPHDDKDIDRMLEFFGQEEFQTRCRADGYRMVWPSKEPSKVV